MQNRRILDMHFREAGAEASPSVETNSLATLWSHLRYGHWSTVVPHTFLLLLEQTEGLISLPLIEPDASHLIGLVASDRDPLTPVRRPCSTSPAGSTSPRPSIARSNGCGRSPLLDEVDALLIESLDHPIKNFRWIDASNFCRSTCRLAT